MEAIELEVEFKVSPEQLYNDWLSTEGHSKMTGGTAKSEPVEGAEHSAWDGYIWGKQLELKPHKYIKQSWRTTEFDDNDTDSFLEISLSSSDNGCKLYLRHRNIPAGQGERYKNGWIEHYFEPMTKYYSDFE